MIGKWTDLPNAPDGFRSKPSANHIDRDSHDGHEIASPDKFTREEMPMKTTTKWWFNFLIVSIGTVAVNFASLAAAVGSGLSHMYDHPTGSQSVIEALPLVLPPANLLLSIASVIWRPSASWAWGLLCGSIFALGILLLFINR